MSKEKKNWAFRAGILLFLILALSAVHAQTPLGINEVFIQNNETDKITNHPIRIPISFEDGKYTAETISSVKIGTLATQVQPTSYYKTGYVRTGIAWVIESLNAGEEKKYTIGEGSSEAFQYNQKINNFLLSGNFKSIVKDIKGKEYAVPIDIDGLNSSNVKLIANGPIVKIIEVTKRHEPIDGGELPYLMTSVVYLTLITGKDYFIADHLLVNSDNLPEDSIASETGGKNNGRIYEDGQHGVIFYDSARIEINTTPENSSVYVLDASYIDPSYLQINSSTSKTFWVMSENAQETLSGMNIGLGVPLTGSFTKQNNYMGGGQALLSRLIVSFGGTITKHPLEEYSIQSGQSLERYNLIDSYFFKEFPDPNAINPDYSFTAPATSYLNGVKGLLNGGDKGIRWGYYDYPVKDMGSAGYYAIFNQEPIETVRFLFSCGKRCANDYITSLRFHLYGAAQLTNNFVGYDPEANPQTNMDYYRSPFFESTNYDPPYDILCDGAYNPKDFIGFCQNATPESHRTDSYGKTNLDYINAYRNAGLGSRIWWHEWTGREPAHLSLGMEGYRYLFTGDPVALFLFKQQADSAAVSPYWYYSNDPQLPHYGGGLTGRARGRALKAVSMAYSITHDSFYKQMADNLIQITINSNRNQQSEGSRGTNPATGENYPVKYYTQTLPHVTNVTKMQPFEQFQISHGLSAAYRDVFGSGDTAVINTIKQIVTDGMFFVWNYAYKTPTNVVNGKPFLNGGNNTVNQGWAGLAKFNILITGQNETQLPPEGINYTYYPGEPQQQMYQGLCNEMRMIGLIRKTDQGFLPSYNQYFEELKNDFLRTWITPKKANPFPNPDTWGINFQSMDDEYLCGLTYFMNIPNAGGISYYQSNEQSIPPGTCVDSDHDGFSTCAGDCSDSNPNTNPGRGETSCTNGTDDNCNGLVDCNDPTCSTAIACSNGGVKYCGDNVIQNPNTYGMEEECDKQAWTNGQNFCTGYLCTPPFTQFANSCTCTESTTIYFNSVTPNTFFEEEAVLLTLNGGGFSTNAKVVIDTTEYTPTTINPSTGIITLSLNGTQTGTIG